MKFLFDGPRDSRAIVLLAHGAGAPMDSAFMAYFAIGLGERGLRVARFEFPYMRARRESGKRSAPDREPVLRATWMEAIERLGPARNLVIGGKSMGGRIASLIADQAGVRGLVCLGYPFHAPGKSGSSSRVEHLRTIATPTLIVQGTRDTLGGRAEVSRYKLSPTVAIEWLEEGDHSFRPLKRSGMTAAQNLEQALAKVSAFVNGLY